MLKILIVIPMTYTEENIKKKEICLAPMLDVTTSNFRRLIRLSSQNTILFTEMIVSSTVLHIEKNKLIERLGIIDKNTIVQIGGSDPKEISNSVSILQTLGCDKFNLNVGCPSSRVQKGCFGAILMKDKKLVSEIVNTVFNKCNVVLSLKIRTGVDDCDSYEFFREFIDYLITNTPVRIFYVHARKCWLKGLSPKQNRNVPPLNYEFVYQIKKEFPDFKFILNGGLKGIKDFEKIKDLDGMMLGREAIKNIMVFKHIDEFVFGKNNKTVNDIMREYLQEFDKTLPVNFRILGPLQHIFHGQKGTKNWKVFLNEAVRLKYSIENFLKQIQNIK